MRAACEKHGVHLKAAEANGRQRGAEHDQRAGRPAKERPPLSGDQQRDRHHQGELWFERDQGKHQAGEERSVAAQ